MLNWEELQAYKMYFFSFARKISHDYPFKGTDCHKDFAYIL